MAKSFGSFLNSESFLDRTRICNLKSISDLADGERAYPWKNRYAVESLDGEGTRTLVDWIERRGDCIWAISVVGNERCIHGPKQTHRCGLLSKPAGV